MIGSYKCLTVCLLTLTSLSVLGHFRWFDFSPHLGDIFLYLCMPFYFWLEVRHCEFYLVACWVFLYSCKCLWTLFWNTEMVWAFWIILIRYVKWQWNSAHCRTDYFLTSTRQGPKCTLISTPWVKTFSIPVYPWVSDIVPFNSVEWFSPRSQLVSSHARAH